MLISVTNCCEILIIFRWRLQIGPLGFLPVAALHCSLLCLSFSIVQNQSNLITIQHRSFCFQGFNYMVNSIRSCNVMHHSDYSFSIIVSARGHNVGKGFESLLSASMCVYVCVFVSAVKLPTPKLQSRDQPFPATHRTQPAVSLTTTNLMRLWCGSTTGPVMSTV